MPDTTPEAVTLAICRLSDCLLSAHPDTPRQATVPDMLDAAVKEIERLRSENAKLRRCHEAELGVCFQHCPEVAELRGSVTLLTNRLEEAGNCVENMQTRAEKAEAKLAEHCAPHVYPEPREPGYVNPAFEQHWNQLTRKEDGDGTM